MNIIYYRCDKGIFAPTDERPSPAQDAQLRRELERHLVEGLVHQHSPGHGWHLVPGQAAIAFNGQWWCAIRPSSEDAVLAHVMDICEAAHLKFEVLWQEAYPQLELPIITNEHRQFCTRPATLQDVAAVLSDLESINYHRLHAVLRSAVGSGA